MFVLLQRRTVIFLNAVTRPTFGVKFKNAGNDANEVRTTRTVSIIQPTLLCPSTIAFNPGSDPSNEYSVTITKACQKKIILESSLRCYNLLSICYVTGMVHSDTWDNIGIILYSLVIGFYL